MRRALLSSLILLSPTWAFASNTGPVDLDAAARRFATASFPELYALLSLPNDAHFPRDIEKNVAFCEAAFAKRGFSTRRLTTPGAPLLLAERTFDRGEKTVLIYLQIDGQPVDPDAWDQESPWTPVLKERDASGAWRIIPADRLEGGTPNPEWRIFARAASDAKGPVAAFLASLDAAAALEVAPDFDIKVIMDFEEELGSPNLPSAVERFRSELAADRLVIFDGPRHISNRPTLTYGARGIAEMTLVVYGPRTPVHSGNYGNYTPNPAMRLARLLASMKDDRGRVTIPGFYDGVQLTQAEKETLRQVPDDEGEIRKFLGIAEPDAIGDNFQESLQYPTLNIRGLDALHVGNEARTLIPDRAVAEIDIRLVPSSDAPRLIALVTEHVARQGYLVLDRAPDEEERMTHARIASIRSSVSYGPFQTPFESPTGNWLRRAMTRAFGHEPIQIRMMGGSIPIAPFVTTLGIPAVGVPTVNPDNNQHAENEN
ncbi:MAG TPA: M20/M25/M40 family metallo-hydrolase, partial [Candidatus Polarisedimenticolaceae bacterium]|nr:M20/M25/M40 family metallo-hydrolase [Candidatus Polarisedimenticolaceae bacterium]